MNKDLIDSFEGKYIPEPNSGCWIWDDGYSGDYGSFSYKGKTWRAHRLSYEINVGPIPVGLHIDHLCRNPSCVNPIHLEPVTSSVNVKRGLLGSLETNKVAMMQKSKTHCPKGHEYSEDNTYYTKSRGRYCAKCLKAKGEKYRKTRDSERIEKNLCKRGHEYTEDNTIFMRDGRRRCKTCDNQARHRVPKTKIVDGVLVRVRSVSAGIRSLSKGEAI